MSINRFDALEMARDLVSRDEAQRLFGIVRANHKQAEGEHADEFSQMDGKDGYLAALTYVMDELDERIGYLRDRWD